MSKPKTKSPHKGSLLQSLNEASQQPMPPGKGKRPMPCPPRKK